MQKIRSLVIPVLIICLFIGIGGVLLYHSWQDVQRGAKTTGQVVEMARVSGRRARINYAPVVEFKTPDAQTHRFQSRMSTSWRSHRIGDTVEVLYDPTNPLNARVNSMTELYLFPSIFISFGASSLFLMLFLPLLLHRKRVAHATRLRSTGTRMEARVIGSKETGLRMNGVTYFALQAQIHDPVSNTVRVFDSDPFSYDPGGIMQKDTPIGVYVNPSNPKEYWVDTSNLPSHFA